MGQMVCFKKNTFVDTSLVTCAEYQLFLDEQRAKGKYYQPDHWEENHFLPGQGRAPILGVRRSDAVEFCSWLTERESGPWRFRCPKVGEIEDLRNEGILDGLPAGNGYWLDESFAWTKEPLFVPDEIIHDTISRDYKEAESVAFLYAYWGGATSWEKQPFHRDVVDHNFNRARNRAAICAIDLEYIFARIRALNLEPKHAFWKGSDWRRAFFKEDFGRAIDRAIPIGRARTQVIKSSRDPWDPPPVRDSDPKVPTRYVARAQVRTFALDCACACWEPMRHTRSSRRLAVQHGDEFFYLYVSLVILEMRSEGKLPACEGILLMKELKMENEFSVGSMKA